MIHNPHRKSGVLQTILVPRKFGLAHAKGWLEAHHFPFTKVDETQDFYRFRQAQPKAHAQYYTKRLPNGVDLVFMK